MQDKINIRHISGPRIFILPHRPVCIMLGVCLCKDKKPSALHVAHGGRVETYAAAINAPDVAKGLRKQQIIVEAVKAKKQVEPPAKKGRGTKGSGSK